MLALLDCRFLEGDRELFSNLRNRLIPEIMVRESQALVERLAELTRNTHRKFANTVFHLEPNVKDGPGGFQDYVTARWLAAISAMESQDGWPDPRHFFHPRSNQRWTRRWLSSRPCAASCISAISETTIC